MEKNLDEKVLEIENLIKEGKGEEALNKANELDKELKDAEDRAKISEILDRAKEMKQQNYGIENSDKEEGAQFMQPKDITYKEVFAKYIHGSELTAEERKVFEENNVQNTATTKSGNAAVIPTETMNKIFEALGETHSVLKDIDILNVHGNLTLPVVTFTDNTDFYDEGDTPTDSATASAAVTLGGYDLKVNIPVSFNLKKMSVDAFMTYIVNKIIEKMGDKLANAVCNGKGTPGVSDDWKAQPLGVIYALEHETSTPHVKTYAAGDNDAARETKLRQMIAAIKSGYNKKFYAKNATIWDFIAGIKDTTGRPIFIPDPTGEFVGRVYGVPVVEEEAVPANAILLGDFRKGYALNFNEDIQVLQQDQNKLALTDYTGYAIVDGKPMFTEAFCYLKKS